MPKNPAGIAQIGKGIPITGHEGPRGMWMQGSTYTEWKGNKCRPFNSRRGRLKGSKNLYTIWGLTLVVSSEKGVSCSVLFTSYCLYR